MKITICGSIAFYEEMRKTKKDLEFLGHIVEMPPGEITAGDGKVMPVMEYYQVRQTATPTDAWIWDRKEEAIKRHFEKVAGADAILVLNHDKKGIVGYIGANTLMEMGLALHLGKRIYLLNQIPEISYREEILGMKPKVINGDFAQIV